MRYRGLLTAGLMGILLPSLVLAADGESGNPLEPVLSTLAWTVITFLIVLFVLWKNAWGPLLKALDDRERRIRDSLEAADRAAEETARLHEEHEALMSQARKEATAIVEEGKRDAVVVKDTIVAEARREAEDMTARAKAEIERAKDIAVHDIHVRVVDLSYNIAEKLIHKSLTRGEHDQLVEATIREYADSN